jgi:hypothetical protein
MGHKSIAQQDELKQQYFDIRRQQGYVSIYDFIVEHRPDLHQEYIAWLAKRRLEGGK